MVMDIAALSMAMSSSSTMQQVSLSMAKKAMDTTEATSQNLLEMMNANKPPMAPGKNIDVYI